MSNKPFYFKEFTINQDRCAMKIGTDSVILSTWVTIRKDTLSILDIGSGTGIIALILAQRSNAQIIDAIEIENNAYEQCVDNFEQSPWSDRLFCYHASLEEFVNEIEDKYNLIVCNPPFYSENYKTNSNQRNLARFQDAMPFKSLLKSVSKLLATEGVFSIVIPVKEEALLITLASEYNLKPLRVLHVKGNPSSQVKRSCIEFTFKANSTNIETLVIENKRHEYTKDYVDLTKKFYLKM